jgi:hypothetical protein
MDGKLAALEDLRRKNTDLELLDKLVLTFVFGWLQKITRC